MVVPEIAVAGISALGNLLGSGVSAFGSNATNRKAQAFAEQQQEKQYEYQRLLNEQSLALSKDYTHWLNTQGYGMMRQGLENAGYNPILAVNASPQFGSISGGSASAGPTANFSNPMDKFGDFGSKLSDSINSAYKTYKLDRDLNKAQVEVLEAQKQNLEEDTRLKKYKNPMTTFGSIVEDLKDYGKSTSAEIVAQNAEKHAKFVKDLRNKLFWKWYDGTNDFYSFLKNSFKGGNVPYEYFKGLSKSYRIHKGVYNQNDLKYDPHF